MGIYMYLAINPIAFLFFALWLENKNMPFFLAVRQSWKPTISPQSQNTYFHEQKDALLFNVSPYVTERDAHVSFPEANKEEKTPSDVFQRCLVWKWRLFAIREKHRERLISYVPFFWFAAAYWPQKNKQAQTPAAQIYPVCYLCQHKIISISFYSIILCQWQMNVQLCLTLVLLTCSFSSSALSFPRATLEFSMGLFSTRWQNISRLG